MIITEFVNIRVSGQSTKHYRDLGYDVKPLDYIQVSINELSQGSHSLIDVQCDYCHKIIQKEYKTLLNERKKSITKKDCCMECSCDKIMESNLSLYNVKNCMMRPEIVGKLHSIVLEKYGVDSASQLIEAKEKALNTNREKYGCDHYSQTDEYKERVKQTNIEKFGVDSYTKTEEYKERKIITSMEKYGTEDPAQSDIVKGKRKNTLLDKYGEDNYFKTDEFKENNKQYWNDNYGVDHYSQTVECQDKMKKAWGDKSIEEIDTIITKRKNTCLERYGFSSVLQIPSIREKMLDANGIPASSQQKEIFSYLSSFYENISLNYPFSSIVLDIAIFLDELKINIEYDAWYWHNEFRDRRRDEFLKSEGWKILRIKSSHLLPDFNILDIMINKIIENGTQYNEIILKDWGKGKQKERRERDNNEQLFNSV